MAHQVLRRLSILGPRSDLRNAMKQLVGCGFTVKVPPEYLGGQNNKTSLIKDNNTGVQLELTTALRKAFFKMEY